MSSMKRSTDTYHHGDLRNALITASIAILAEEGSAALTLRKAARKAGGVMQRHTVILPIRMRCWRQLPRRGFKSCRR